ncbi:MAG: hypothetical protein EBU26_11760, partial [Verrucomicrobia bacterium]|nr:hypothetical protein [Verrucomicrobiota bacterium]
MESIIHADLNTNAIKASKVTNLSLQRDFGDTETLMMGCVLVKITQELRNQRLMNHRLWIKLATFIWLLSGISLKGETIQVTDA